MNKEVELKRAKRRATLLLLIATAVFVATVLMRQDAWIGAIKAVAEAAMVGALADWFAVVALFRRVPIPGVAAHTAIIPQNKDKIADNLALFVREKFLDESSIAGLIRKHDPAQSITNWLSVEANTQRLGGYVVKLTGGILGLLDDARIQSFMKDALDAMLDKVDLSKATGSVLDTLTRDGRHQQLLDEGIDHLMALLREPGVRTFIAEQIVDWFKREYPTLEKFMPSDMLGETGANIVADTVNNMLLRVSEDPGHKLRHKFDDAAARLVVKLKSDPAFLQKGEEIKRYIKDSENLSLYVKDLWGQLRDWLRRDLERDDSVLRAKVAAMGQWIGRELAQDESLRRSLNQHMEDAARAMAPDVSGYLTRHISDTVKNWDSRDMSQQIELNIGKDLQYIRINVTIVGGCIGLLLYASSKLFALVPLHIW
ncbi:DUF445 family protein [Paraburkholderia sp. C35]|uniref:DUF445 domain-containing protein n=1 Tax=Paraburkholderia sp. C35 TaxID=2126993 RepID=UPI000D68698B|nr:DUF445 family protein [Paraburkholderia sp. C35]